MGNCQTNDGNVVHGAGNREQCWERGGDKWVWFGGMQASNPARTDKIRSEVATAAAEAEAAKTAVAAADAATTTAAAATAVAAAADAAAVKAEATKVEATAAADVAAAAALSAKAVRDKCIADANNAHKVAMEKCGKEGFGQVDPSSCMLWIMTVLIVLVFVAICLKAGSEGDRDLKISDAFM